MTPTRPNNPPNLCENNNIKKVIPLICSPESQNNESAWKEGILPKLSVLIADIREITKIPSLKVKPKLYKATSKQFGPEKAIYFLNVLF